MSKENVVAVISGAGWIASFADQLVQGLREHGCSDEEIHALVTTRGNIPMEKIVEEVAKTIHPSITLARDLRKEEYTPLEGYAPFEGHTPPEYLAQRIISVSGLEMVRILKGGESSIDGEELVRRARTELNANYSKEDAEFLSDHQWEIPKEFQHFNLIFTAGVSTAGIPGSPDSGAITYVTCLSYSPISGWGLRFRSLRDGFGSRDRLPRGRN